MDNWTVWVAMAVVVGLYLMVRQRIRSPVVPEGPPQPGARVAGVQARALVEEGALLLDVRSPGEFSMGHIEGARNLPVQELGAKLDTLDKAQPIVVYCRSGQRSGQAMQLLRGQGFDQVYDLGPRSAW